MALQETTPNEPWTPEDTFGARLALIRQTMRWNVKEAAEACGINYQSWHNWEAGSLPRDLYKVVEQIAQAAGCSERWLLMGSQNRKDLTGADLRLVHDAAQLQLFRVPTSGDRSRRGHLQAVPS